MSLPSGLLVAMMSIRFRVVALLTLIGLVGLAAQSTGPKPQAPRFWNDRELAEWATPIAALDVRPSHFSEREYYAAPAAEWVRTYPVYFPGREPAGYWEMLRARKPEPLIALGARTEAEWIDSGRRVFEEMDVPTFRSTDPQIIAMVRSGEELARRGGQAQKDGRVLGLRWVPTSKGLSLGVSDCSGCHTRVLPDGSLLNGAPFNVPLNGVLGELATRGTTIILSRRFARDRHLARVHRALDPQRHPRQHEIHDGGRGRGTLRQHPDRCLRALQRQPVLP